MSQQTITGGGVFSADNVSDVNANFTELYAGGGGQTFTSPTISGSVAGAATYATPTLTTPVISTGLTASGSATNDFSGSTGAFKTSSGANTLSGAVTATSSLLSSAALGGVGYGTGAGGTITQITDRTTGVTINKCSGAITLVSAAGSATPASFTVTNSAVAATDVVIVNQKSGTDLYEIFVTAVGAGSFQITSFTTGGTTTEQPVFNFAVIKAVAA